MSKFHRFGKLIPLSILVVSCTSRGISMMTPSSVGLLGQSSGSLSDAQIDACSLLTNQEAEAILKLAVTDVGPSFFNPLVGSMCSYVSAEESSDSLVETPVHEIVLSAVTTADLQRELGQNHTAASFYRSMRASVPSPPRGNLQLILGLGDEAVWYLEAHQLWVLRGEVILTITIYYHDPPDGFDLVEASKAVAMKALMRLP